jgi:dTDP-4-amino-4,6-dideoxygalactose transaminase
VLAVVATNLYGLPSDLPRIVAVARQHGAFVVDDAAQAMGASVAGGPSGTRGDVGLFSFDKGKALSAIDGGAIVTNRDDVAEALAAALDRLPEPAWSTIPEYVAKAAVYAAFLKPAVYGIPNSIPALNLGATRYTTEYAITRYSPLLAQLALVMLPQLDRFVAARTANAAGLRERLARTPGLVFPRVLPEARASWVRFPVLAAGRAARDEAVARLRHAGIGASGSYPQSIADVAGAGGDLAPVGRVSGARDLASRILTLPTHPYVAAADLERIARVLGGRGLLTAASVCS